MTNDLRLKDFRLGCLHGKLHAEDANSEAHIQRTIFLSQSIRVWRTRKEAPVIRIFGYEVPIQDHMRGKCIDLLGYDKNLNLYIIELKKKESSESADKVIRQINGYACKVQKILHNIEEDFKETYFFPLKFTAIKKMILAPREFYKDKKQLFTDPTIEYAYFRVVDINKAEPKAMVNVHLVK